MRQTRFFRILFALLLLSPIQLQAQSGKDRQIPIDDPCLSIDIIQSLVHLPFTEVLDVLTEQNYTIGSVTDTVFDTVESFPLKYLRTAFYYQTSTNASVVLMESLEGLSNYVIYTRSPKGDCHPLQELAQHNYVLTKGRSFQGSVPFNGTIELFEIVLNEDSNIWLSCKYIEELNQYIGQKKAAVSLVINNALAAARRLTADHHFDSALSTLDTLLNYYKPLNDTLLSCRYFVEQQRNKYYSSLLNQAINNLNYLQALDYCDTLLSFAPLNSNEINKTRSLLKAQLDHSVASFRQFHPDVYDTIRLRLQQVLNQDIREHLYSEPQELRLNFTLRTNRENESKGSFDLKHNTHSNRIAKNDISRLFRLNQIADSLAKAPIIRPTRENNIYIITEDPINASVLWNYSTLTINGNNQQDSSLLSRYIDTIDNRYFSTTIASKKQLNEDGTYKLTTVRRLPTKRIYTFGVTQKEANSHTYSDIYLVDFQTAMGDSWLPSLLIPGLGTYHQEARYDVVSRALPFYLFGGIGIAGLWWEHHCKVNNIPRTNASDNDGLFIYWKNSGYIVGGLGLFVAGSIYITDLVGGIKNSINNAKRSKALRQRLKESAIILQTQDVIIQ